VERHVEFARLHNFRDLGGYVGADGRAVRWRQLYRADSLGKLAEHPGDWETFQALGIGTVIDLRHEFEVTRHGRVPEHPGRGYHNLSIEHQPWDLTSLGPDVVVARFLADRYAEVAEDGAREIRAVLDLLTDAPAPVVFHCAAGKDRTGLIAAFTLDLLGVGEADIVADFARTELARTRFLTEWLADHEGVQPRWLGFGHAPAEAMQLFLTELSQQYGSMRGYTADRLGVSGDQVEALRRRYLQG
jgi:protein-tyrosine phosphatase